VAIFPVTHEMPFSSLRLELPEQPECPKLISLVVQQTNSILYEFLQMSSLFFFARWEGALASRREILTRPIHAQEPETPSMPRTKKRQ